MAVPNIGAWITAHKVPVLAVGGAAAVGLGLRARKNKTAASSGVSPAPGAPGSMTGMVPTFDSTANDVYSSIEPQISAQAGALSGLSNSLLDIQNQLAHLSATATHTGVPVSTLPVPTAPAPSMTMPSPAPIIPPNLPSPNANFIVNDPAVNPNVAPAPPVALNAGDTLGPATGSGQRYTLPGGNTVVYG